MRLHTLPNTDFVLKYDKAGILVLTYTYATLKIPAFVFEESFSP